MPSGTFSVNNNALTTFSIEVHKRPTDNPECGTTKTITRQLLGY